MKLNWKLVAGSLAGAVAIHVVFLACGPNRGPEPERDGAMGMIDAARDAVGDVLGAETGDAMAQSMPMQVTCDQTRVVTTTGANGYVSTTTYYYADVPVPGIDPATVPHATAALCDYAGSRDECGGNPSCSATGYVLPTGSCSIGAPSIASGHVIVSCGYTLQITAASPDGGVSHTMTDGRYNRVYLRLE